MSGNKYNFRRRIYGTNPSTNVLSRTLKNISNLGIDTSILNSNMREFSKTSDELNHYSAFFDEDANEVLREDLWKDIEEVKKFLDDNIELKNIVETFVDSCIVYDKSRKFSKLELDKTLFEYSASHETEMLDLYSKTMKQLNFNKEQEAWGVFYEMAVGGKVAYELVYKTVPRREVREKKNELIKKIRLNEASIKTYSSKMVNLNEDKNIRSTVNRIIKENDLKKNELAVWNNRLNLYESFRKYKNEELKSDVSIEDLSESLDDDEELYDLVSKSDYLIEEEEGENGDDDDEIPVERIGMKRINAFNVHRVNGKKPDGSIVELWKIMDKRGRIYYLPEQCIVVADWSSIASSSELTKHASFLNGLLRNYNLTRSLEESKVGWSILAGQFRLKMVVPTGSKIGTKAKESVTKLVNQYKERLTIDSATGVVKINGQKDYKFGSNIALPSRTGNTTTIDSISYNGVDLSNMEVVNYFRDGVYRDSTIPASRFDRENAIGGLVLFKAEGVPYDELMFHKRCNRSTVEFSKLIRKPIYYDSVLKYPSLALDDNFYDSIGVIFNSDGYFEKAKEFEVTEATMRQYSTFERIQDANREPIFDTEFLLVDKFKIVSPEEWELNKRKKADTKAKNKEEGGDDQGGLGGLGGL